MSLVEYHGRMRTVPGKSYFVGEKSGEPVYPAGTSLFWSSASSRYYNAGTVSGLKKQFNAQIVRVAMTAWSGWSDGYTTNPSKYLGHVVPVVEAAIKEGMYVIIDWHCEGDNSGYVEQAKTFFRDMAQRYGGYPNIIYEIWNEPTKQSWDQVIRPYCIKVIQEIRKWDSKNLILCGTETWSQKVEDATKNPIPDNNVAYVLHFYSNLHGPWLYQNKAKLGVPVFVSEWGTPGEHTNTKGFLDWLETNKVPHVSWALNNKAEPLSYLEPGCTDVHGPWDEKELTRTGEIFLNIIQNWPGNKISTASPISNPVSPVGPVSPAPVPQSSSNSNQPTRINMRFEAESYKNASPGVQIQSVSGIRFVSFNRNRSWVVWEIEIPVDGSYTVQYRVSSKQEGKLRLDYNAGKDILGIVNVPKTNGWETINHSVRINKGKYRLGINALESGWSLDWWSLTL
jgi:endoglucanase